MAARRTNPTYIASRFRRRRAESCLAVHAVRDDHQAVIFGWVLVGLGLLGMVFPRPVVAAARGWRLVMPSVDNSGAFRVARAGALIVLIAGLVLALA